jgi:hypothetical protein
MSEKRPNLPPDVPEHLREDVGAAVGVETTETQSEEDAAEMYGGQTSDRVLPTDVGVNSPSQ